MKAFKLLAAVAAILLVAACLFSPGKFDARMSVMKDGSFTYHYVGEIQMITGQSMMGAVSEREAAEEQFDAAGQLCTGEEGSEQAAPPPGSLSVVLPTASAASSAANADADIPEYRDCTAAELEVKRREWESGRAERRAAKDRENAAMKAMFGGIDPNDPATMAEFARRLQGQGGWKKVVFKGNGLFDVDYEIAGRLDHDFVFPLFPNMDIIIPFVQAAQSGARKVRVSAPAFVRPGNGIGGTQAMGAAAMMGKTGNDWPFKSPEGSFTLTTDGSILTNNTHDGPVAQGALKVLTWKVTPLDTQKPEALIQL
jgi:hypothetical protein